HVDLQAKGIVDERIHADREMLAIALLHFDLEQVPDAQVQNLGELGAHCQARFWKRERIAVAIDEAAQSRLGRNAKNGRVAPSLRGPHPGGHDSQALRVENARQELELVLDASCLRLEE